MAVSKIGFLTDVEGNLEYFHKYIQLSKVLKYEDEEKTTLKLEDGAMFVFGGTSPPLFICLVLCREKKSDERRECSDVE